MTTLKDFENFILVHEKKTGQSREVKKIGENKWMVLARCQVTKDHGVIYNMPFEQMLEENEFITRGQYHKRLNEHIRKTAI